MAKKKATQRPQKSKATNPVRGSSDTAPQSVSPIVDEPTGIDRDFTHLWHTVRFGLNYALTHGWLQTSNELRHDNAQTRTRRNDADELFGAIEAQAMRSELIRLNAQRDTLGVEPYALFDNALPKEYTPTPDLQQVLDKWVLLYLERVGAIVHRWKKNGETDVVNTRLSTLCEQVREWQLYPTLVDGVAPAVLTALEGAQRNIAEGIAAVATTSPDGSTTPLERIEWKGSTIEFVTIVRNLVKSNYIDLPSKNGKGDGNETELFRRLQQVVIVRNVKGKEITPELVKNRASGKRIGGSREKQFDLPEATRKKVKKTN